LYCAIAFFRSLYSSHGRKHALSSRPGAARPGEVAGLQVELARVFERAAARVDAQRFVVELLGSPRNRRRALAQACAIRLFQSRRRVVEALELVRSAPDQFLAAICSRTAESLSGAGCGLGWVSAAKALVANSSGR